MKSFFRQVFAMIRENKLFSAVYIVGTAVAIAFTMVMVIAYYVKIAPVYPETNRMRTMYLGTAVYVDTVHFGSSGSGFSPDALNEWGYHLKNAEVVSGSVGNMGMIRTEGDIHDYLVKQIYTDVNFFKVYPFRFKEGRPFTQEEFDGAAHVAVISDEQARKTYGSDKGIVVERCFSMQTPCVSSELSNLQVHILTVLMHKSILLILYGCTGRKWDDCMREICL